MLTNDGRLWVVGVMLISALAEPAAAQTTPEVFGYLSTRIEKSWEVPSLTGDSISTESPPKEFSYPFFAVMLRHEPANRVQVFLNLNGSTSGGVTVRNAWGFRGAGAVDGKTAGKPGAGSAHPPGHRDRDDVRGLAGGVVLRPENRLRRR
jgi:hypothetical protein